MTTSIRQNMAQPVAEGASAHLSWKAIDHLKNPIPLAGLGTLTWSHYNEATGLIINGRTDIDIKNANGGTVHATTGECTLVIPPADNIIIVPSPSEWHVAFLRWTYNGGAGVGEKEIAFRIVNTLP